MSTAGLNKYGQSLTEVFNLINQTGMSRSHPVGYDHIVGLYSSSLLYHRDITNSKLITDKLDNLNKVTIVGGNLPICYIHSLSNKYQDCKITIIEDSKPIHIVSDIIKDLYNVEIINKNVVFEDLYQYTFDDDLTIFPETETLPPFNLFKYKLPSLKFVSNFKFYDYKHNINVVTDTEQLAELCYITDVIDQGSFRINSKDYNRYSFYLIGR